MNRSTTAITARDPATFALWVWFGLGAIACACFPQLRGRDPFWGWLPYWCLVAPLLDLGLLYRCRLAAASRSFLVRVRRRRRPARQARRSHTRRTLRRPLQPHTASP
jgi:hypothetical protein